MPKTSESKSEVIAEAERRQASTEATAFAMSKKLPRTPTTMAVTVDVHQPSSEAQQSEEVVTPSKLSVLKEKAQDTVKRVFASIREKTPAKLAQEAESFKAFLRITPPGNTPPASTTEAPVTGSDKVKTVSAADARLLARELEASMQNKMKNVPSAKSLEEHLMDKKREEHEEAHAKAYFGKAQEQAEALFEEIAASKRSSRESVKSAKARESTSVTYSRLKAAFSAASATNPINKTLTEQEAREAVSFRQDEVERIERDIHAFDDEDPIAALALKARARRQLQRRLREDRRDALYSARRKDEQK